MKTEIKYISKELERLQSKVIYHTWHFNFTAVFFFMKDEKFSLYCSHIYTEKITDEVF